VRGTTIAGRYEVIDLLGSGGMAAVWRARDTVLDREVALKVLAPAFASDPTFRTRFEREARHAARLTHPGIVTIFDSGADGQVAWIAMELVGGRTIRTVLAEDGPVPVDTAVRIAAEVCDALGAAHAAGIVHRDIKPANIVLTPDGRVKVVDFGIARLEGADQLTQTAGVIGTAAYLSPEQAAGGTAGPASDLYAVGCVLVQMLTGAPPFEADTPVALAYRQVHDEPRPPSAVRRDVPPEVDAVALRLLAKDVAARPATATLARDELLASVERTPTQTLVMEPLTAVPAPGPAPMPLVVSPSVPVGASGGRSRWPLVLVGLCALAAVIGFAVARQDKPAAVASQPGAGSSPSSARPSAAVTTLPPVVPPAQALAELAGAVTEAEGEGAISEDKAAKLRKAMAKAARDLEGGRVTSLAKDVDAISAQITGLQGVPKIRSAASALRDSVARLVATVPASMPQDNGNHQGGDEG
jgi:predicted Ser/Thr protein kinase